MDYNAFCSRNYFTTKLSLQDHTFKLKWKKNVQLSETIQNI